MKRHAGDILRGAILSAAALASGCTAIGLTAAADIGGREWRSPVMVAVTNTDTLVLRDMTVFLRCNDRFRDDTLTLRLETFTPDSLRFAETFVFTPDAASDDTATGTERSAHAERRGHRSAAHTASPVRREATSCCRTRVRLGAAGTYRFVITPCRPVEGVEAAGIHFENRDR